MPALPQSSIRVCPSPQKDPVCLFPVISCSSSHPGNHKAGSYLCSFAFSGHLLRMEPYSVCSSVSGFFPRSITFLRVIQLVACMGIFFLFTEKRCYVEWICFISFIHMSVWIASTSGLLPSAWALMLQFLCGHMWSLLLRERAWSGLLGLYGKFMFSSLRN